MIARLTVRLPFVIVVPEGAQYPLRTWVSGEYEITVRPPGRTDLPLLGLVPEHLQLGGQPAFVADGLVIDFRKGGFDRRKEGGIEEPPASLMEDVVNHFLQRLRYVARAAHVHPLDLHKTTWRLRYLNDDESEVTEEPTLYRGRGGRSWDITLINVPPSIWEDIYTIEDGWEQPVWDDILLDGFNALPRVGSALVLGATAVEVFAGDVLDRLAARGDIPVDIWTWLNDRKNHFKDPSTEEQLDKFLKHFIGHSLKEDLVLWQAFQELRRARNNFVHGGRAHLGGVEVTQQKAQQLLLQAAQVISTVRGWLPQDLQWRTFETLTELAFSLPVF